MSDFKFEISETIKFNNLIYCSMAHLVKTSPQGHIVKVDISPTYNCQVFSIGLFKNIFGSTLDYENAEAKVVEIAKLCKTTKRLCQIDINRPIFNKIKDHVNIHSSLDYLSTNGSQMTLVLIKI